MFLSISLLVIVVLSGEPSSRRSLKLLRSYTHRTPTKTEDAEGVMGSTPLMRSALAIGQAFLDEQRTGRILVMLDRAGLRLQPNEWLVIRGIALIFGFAVFSFLTHNLWIGLIVGLPFGFLVPHVWVRHLITKRQRDFVDRLPDALQLVAGSLGAGYSLLQALDGLVQEGEEPIAGEIARALATARLGVPIEEALTQVAERVGSTDFAWTAMAIRIQREVGGNLAEVLMTVAETLRERASLRRQVRALSAEGRLSGYILVAIPVLMGVYELLFRRDYMSIMWTKPLGMALMAGTVLLMTVGWFWMRAVVNVEV